MWYPPALAAGRRDPRHLAAVLPCRTFGLVTSNAAAVTGAHRRGRHTPGRRLHPWRARPVGRAARRAGQCWPATPGHDVTAATFQRRWPHPRRACVWDDTSIWPGKTVDVHLLWDGVAPWPDDVDVFVHLRRDGANRPRTTVALAISCRT
ncbi:MAG: hypothetical protein R2838_22580 [Caldilineaceae bacterium]